MRQEGFPYYTEVPAFSLLLPHFHQWKMKPQTFLYNSLSIQDSNPQPPHLSEGEISPWSMACFNSSASPPESCTGVPCITNVSSSTVFVSTFTACVRHVQGHGFTRTLLPRVTPNNGTGSRTRQLVSGRTDTKQDESEEISRERIQTPSVLSVRLFCHNLIPQAPGGKFQMRKAMPIISHSVL